MLIYIYFVVLLSLIVLCMFLDPRPKFKKKEIKENDNKQSRV